MDRSALVRVYPFDSVLARFATLVPPAGGPLVHLEAG